MTVKTELELANLLSKIVKLPTLELIKAKLKEIVFVNEDEAKLDFFFAEVTQIVESQTIERAVYYLNRLVRALTESKTNKVNDINLNRWKEYSHILTDSLWLLDKRAKPNTNKAWYWGNFVPEIPSQLLTRYTKKGEWVLDLFAGSGTTLFEARNLGRNAVGLDLNKEVVDHVDVQLHTADNPWFSEDAGQGAITHIQHGNSMNPDDVKYAMKNAGTNSAQFVILHPPYWDIIKFSNDVDDLSNAKDIDDFLQMLALIADNAYKALDDERYMALIIGDKYVNGELIPLGFKSMDVILQSGFSLKSIIVKNYDQTKGKMGQEELWRYRALVGGFYVFKHEYIFLFQKQ